MFGNTVFRAGDENFSETNSRIHLKFSHAFLNICICQAMTGWIRFLMHCFSQKNDCSSIVKKIFFVFWFEIDLADNSF